MITDLRNAGARRPGLVQLRWRDNAHDFPFLAGPSCVTCVALLIGNGPEKGDEQLEVDSVFGTLLSLEADRSSVQPLGCDRQRSILSAEEHTVTPIFTDASFGKASSEDGLTALQAAVALGAPDLVQGLVEAGVDVNAVDHNGFSALHYAAIISNDYASPLHRDSLIRTLLDAKADPCQRDRMGRTPLHLASMVVEWRQRAKIQQLAEAMETREAGANATDAAGNTALHLAVSLSLVEAIEALLQIGADKNIKNTDGQTPLSMAKNHPHILELIRMSCAGPGEASQTDVMYQGAFDSAEVERLLPVEIEEEIGGGDGGGGESMARLKKRGS